MKFILEVSSAVGALFRHLASMAQKLFFTLGATVENEALNKACNEKCNGEGEEYLHLSGNVCNSRHEGQDAENQKNFLTNAVVHISQAPPCYSFSCRGGG